MQNKECLIIIGRYLYWSHPIEAILICRQTYNDQPIRKKLVDWKKNNVIKQMRSLLPLTCILVGRKVYHTYDTSVRITSFSELKRIPRGKSIDITHNYNVLRTYPDGKRYLFYGIRKLSDRKIRLLVREMDPKHVTSYLISLKIQ